MFVQCRFGGVFQPLCAVGLAISLGMPPVHAIPKNWNNASGNWGDAGSWSPAGVPDFDDHVNLGNLAGVNNDWVTLNQDAFISELTVTDGMKLDTDGQEIVVQGTTSISGVNHAPGNVTHYSTIVVHPNNLLAAFDTDVLQLSDHGRLKLENGAIVEIDQTATLGDQTWLERNGEIRLKGNGGVALTNNGTIDAGNIGLHIKQLGTAKVDLDGVTGNGRVRASILGSDEGPGSRFSITGTGLTDAFDGEMTIAGGAQVDMDLDEGWALGVNGSLSMFPGGAARLTGSHVHIHGLIENAGTLSRIDADATFHSDARVLSGQGRGLELTGATNIVGGHFDLGADSELSFSGPTTVRGGMFDQSGEADITARIQFNNSTSWRGNAHFGAIVSQNGSASVNESSTVHATLFDLDGQNDNTNWNVHHNLSVHTNAIDSAGSNRFDGVMTSDSTSTTAGAIAIHLPVSDRWQMDGTLNLGGNASIYSTRVAGSPMDVTGTIDVNATKVSISADTQLQSGSTVNFSGLTSQLRFTGETHVDNNVSLTGLGTIRNSGSMTLADNLNTGFVKIENGGDLQIGEGPANVEVNRFTNEANGTLNIEIAGLIAGNQFDKLEIDGATALAGTLSVSFLNGFLPQVGDEFTILQQSVGTIQDTFHSVQGHLATNGVLLLPEYLAQAVKLVAVPHLPCDLNLDGGVDASDMGIMFGEWGTAGTTDLNHDGYTDAADAGICFADWTGDAAPALVASTAVVPEPSIMGGLLLIGLLLGRSRGRRYVSLHNFDLSRSHVQHNRAA